MGQMTEIQVQPGDNPFPLLDPASWGGWESLGGVLTSPPKVVTWGRDRLDVFAVGTDSALWHRSRDAAEWGAWESRSAARSSRRPRSSPPAPACFADVFALGTDHALWHRWWDGAEWRGWEPLGGVLSSPVTAASWGRLDVFGLGEDHAVWHRWWDGAAWRGWEPLGGMLTAPPRPWPPGRAGRVRPGPGPRPVAPVLGRVRLD